MSARVRTGSSVDAPSRSGTLDWERLLRTAGMGTMAVLAVAAVVLRDLEAAAVTAGFAVALGLLFVRRGLAGQLLLALMSTNVAVWMTLGAASNIAGGDGVVSLLFPAALAATSVAGLVAAVAVLAGRRRPATASRGPVGVAVGGGIALAALLVAGALTGGWAGQAPAGDADLVLVSENAAFSETALTADAGVVSVSMANRDLFWHTFTIEELGLNLNVPVNGERTTTFEAPAGTYRFTCRIPGHEGAGMVGTLTVR